MEIVLPPYESLVIRQELIIRHGDQEMKWNIDAFARSNFEKDLGIFAHINGYWKHLQASEQQRIYDLFLELRGAFDMTIRVDDLDQQVTSVVSRLYELHTFERVSHWVRFHGGITFPKPPDLYPDFVESADKNHTRAKTYTIDDYIDLVGLIVQLRLMIPIWGEYILRTGGAAGTNFKEYQAFHLLNHSEINRVDPLRPEQHGNRAMVKLRTYVNEIVPKEGNPSAIIELVSSEEYSTWILALLVVRRLCLADIRGIVDSSAVLIKHISRHVRERVHRTDNSFRGVLREKIDPSEAGNDDNQISRVEGYKIRQEISAGDVAYMQHKVGDPYEVAERISPGIPRGLVAEMLKSMKTMELHEVQPAQVLLLKWLITPVISARGVEYLEKLHILNCLCAVSAVLWHRDHQLLAGLATATVTRSNGEIVLSGVDSRGRLSADTTAQLTKLYPWQRRNRSGKLAGTITQAIDTMVDLFSDKSWTLTVSEEKVAILNPRSIGVRRIAIPHNFKTKVAELVLDLNEMAKARPSEDYMAKAAQVMAARTATNPNP